MPYCFVKYAIKCEVKAASWSHMMHSGRPYRAMKLCLIALQISGVVVVFEGHSVTKFETSHNRISRYFHGLPELAGVAGMYLISMLILAKAGTLILIHF